MKPLTAFVKFTDQTSVVIGKTVSYFMVLVIISATIEIVSRYFFNRPTIWAYETGQFLFGGYFLLLGAYTLRYREHIGMDIIITKLSPRKQAIMNAATFVFAAMFCLVMIYKGGQFAWKSIRFFEHSTSVWGPPIWPLKAALPVAGFLMLMQATSNLIKDLHMAVTGTALIEDEEVE